MTGRQKPVNQLTKTDLKPGDRVQHFEYGAGTVDAVGEFLYITWDNPKVRLSHHHFASILPFLSRA